MYKKKLHFVDIIKDENETRQNIKMDTFVVCLWFGERKYICFRTDLEFPQDHFSHLHSLESHAAQNHHGAARQEGKGCGEDGHHVCDSDGNGGVLGPPLTLWDAAGA